MSHFKNASEVPAGGRLIAIRRGGSIRVTRDGLLHIVEPFCGPTGPRKRGPGITEAPDVQWWVIQGCQAFSIGGAPPAGFGTYQPYYFPLTPQANTWPNPHNPSPIPGLANVTRRWTTFPVPWMFNIPDYIVQPGGNPLANGAPPPPGSHAALLAQDVFMTCGALLTPAISTSTGYTYGEALWDVAVTMERYTSYTPYPDLPSESTWGASAWGVGHPGPAPFNDPPGFTGQTGTFSPTAMGLRWTTLQALFSGYTYHFPYVLPAAGGATYSGLTWLTTNGGPTGDNINEIAWCAGSLNPAGAYGLTSMLVDPTNGIISECDVLLASHPNTSNQSSPPIAWTAGQTPYQSPNSLPPFISNQPNYPNGGPPNFGTPSGTSAIPHELGHFFGLDHTNLHPGSSPGVGNGPSGSPLENSALLTFTTWEDVPVMGAGIYFTQPWGGTPPTAPGFHMTSAFAVRPLMDPASGGLHADDIVGICRLYPATGAGANKRALINDFARFEGQTLKDVGSQTVPQWGRNVYVLGPGLGASGFADTTFNAAVSGTHRLGSSSIMGARDLATGQTGTADFILPFVSPDPSGAGTNTGAEFALVVEHLSDLMNSSLNDGIGHFSEWWLHPGPMVPGSGLPTPPTTPPNNTPPPLIPVLMTSHKVYPGTSKGSLYAFPGSVITLTINESQGTQAPGTAWKTYTEPVSRPAVKISPRTGYMGPGTPITVTVFSDYPLDMSTAIWQVGLESSLAAGDSVTVTPSSGPGPYVSTWSVTAGAIGISGKVLVRFSVMEKPSDRTLTFVAGVNECWF